MRKKPAARRDSVTREDSPTKSRSKSPTKKKKSESNNNLLLPNGEDNSEAEASTKDSGYDETEAVPAKVRASASPDIQRSSRSRKPIDSSKQAPSSPKKQQKPKI